MTRAPRQTNAGRSPLSRRPARQSYTAPEKYAQRRVRAIGAPTAPTVVPMLEELAALVTADLLASVRRQVQPGERIALYAAAGAPGRALIVGCERHHVAPPRKLDGRWRLAGIVEVLEDGERSLPIARRLSRAVA